MKKLEIIALVDKEDFYKKLPFYYVPANYNKILCVKYSSETGEIKYNLRDQNLLEILSKIFTKTFFDDKFGKYKNCDIQLYCLVNWQEKELLSLYAICGYISNEIVNVAEIANFIDIIKPAEFKYITTVESLDSLLAAATDRDLFIKAECQELLIYNYKK